MGGAFSKIKTPRVCNKVAKYLKSKGISFHLDMIGGGVLEGRLKALVKEYQLEDKVTFHGFLPPQEVRRYMECADVFIYQQLS